MGLNIYAYLAIAVVLIGAATFGYFRIYNSGADSVKTEAVKNYNKIEGKTNAAKTDAFTTDSVDDQLRKFSRPDDNK